MDQEEKKPDIKINVSSLFSPLSSADVHVGWVSVRPVAVTTNLIELGVLLKRLVEVLKALFLPVLLPLSLHSLH